MFSTPFLLPIFGCPFIVLSSIIFSFFIIWGYNFCPIDVYFRWVLVDLILNFRLFNNLWHEFIQLWTRTNATSAFGTFLVEPNHLFDETRLVLDLCYLLRSSADRCKLMKTFIRIIWFNKESNNGL